jgi:hypothetical protein
MNANVGGFLEFSVSICTFQHFTHSWACGVTRRERLLRRMLSRRPSHSNRLWLAVILSSCRWLLYWFYNCFRLRHRNWLWSDRVRFPLCRGQYRHVVSYCYPCLLNMENNRIAWLSFIGRELSVAMCSFKS